MANKALAKRQKMTIRVEPSQRALKARNATAPDAKQRVAGAQRKTGSSGLALQQRLLKKVLGNSDDK